MFLFFLVLHDNRELAQSFNSALDRDINTSGLFATKSELNCCPAWLAGFAGNYERVVIKLSP
jgi:type IV secretory pathway VirB4 component